MESVSFRREKDRASVQETPTITLILTKYTGHTVSLTFSALSSRKSETIFVGKPAKTGQTEPMRGMTSQDPYKTRGWDQCFDVASSYMLSMQSELL